MNTNHSSDASNVSATATSTSSSSSLKRKLDDVGWDYGELCDSKDLNAVKCNFCRSIFKGGIYRLKCHLAHYGTNFKKCQKVLDEAKKRCWEALAGPLAKQLRKLGPLDKFSLKNMDVSKIFEKDLKQQRLDDSIAKKRMNDVHPYVARWVYQAGILFTAIAHPSFIAMMEAVVARLVLEKRPKLFWSCCAVHTIDLILERISKISKFHNAITKAKNLTIFIYAQHRTVALMPKYALKTYIVKPGVTRFATSFLTLQSLYEKKEKLRLMFTLDEWQKSKQCKSR
ncbi:hypothetical protein SLEP1_g30003 [Rubroshorea leprosula]|uniref:DUF659 domain-containing protein n=1 Tax=Rubroshorea leprosula TaxID=152421 RepID=A0AAV5K4T1_9ROSI|nr:hypothetical protein SLEP1_g30003 [Rubroshorea leprosula]